MQHNYKVIREFSVPTAFNGVSHRMVFDVDGELFFSSRVHQGTEDDVTAIFPGDLEGELDLDRYLSDEWDFFEVPNTDHASAIMQWLDQR